MVRNDDYEDILADRRGGGRAEPCVDDLGVVERVVFQLIAMATNPSPNKCWLVNFGDLVI